MLTMHLPADTFLGMGQMDAKTTATVFLLARSLPADSQSGPAESASSADHPVRDVNSQASLTPAQPSPKLRG